MSFSRVSDPAITRMLSMYIISLMPISLRTDATALVIFVKTHESAKGIMQAVELKCFPFPPESYESPVPVVDHRDGEVCILQIYFGHEVSWPQEVFEDVNSLHLKVLMAYELVQLFQVDYWSVSTVFMLGPEIGLSKSHPLDST